MLTHWPEDALELREAFGGTGSIPTPLVALNFLKVNAGATDLEFVSDLIPPADNANDLGSASLSWNQLFIDNDGGQGIVFPTAVNTWSSGPATTTDYTIFCGGGADNMAMGNEGGTFTFLMDDVVSASTDGNVLLFDLGAVSSSGSAENSVTFRAKAGGSIGQLDLGFTFPGASQTIVGLLLNSTAVAAPYDDASQNFDFFVDNTTGTGTTTGHNLIVKDKGVDVLTVGARMTPLAGNQGAAMIYNPILNAANTSDAIVRYDGSVEYASARSLLAQLWLAKPTMIPNGNTITDAANLYIEDAPTAATTNYAIWVDFGVTRCTHSASAQPASNSGYH